METFPYLSCQEESLEVTYISLTLFALIVVPFHRMIYRQRCVSQYVYLHAFLRLLCMLRPSRGLFHISSTRILQIVSLFFLTFLYMSYSLNYYIEIWYMFLQYTYKLPISLPVSPVNVGALVSLPV